jgi:hypothetical protein
LEQHIARHMRAVGSPDKVHSRSGPTWPGPCHQHIDPRAEQNQYLVVATVPINE